MATKRLLENTAEVNALAERLGHYESISKLDDQAHTECGALALAMSDIEGSCHRIVSDLLPKLVSSEASEEQVCEKLVEISEEIRHILYHAKDCRYLQDHVF